MESSSPDFVAGKNVHADMSRSVVNPVADGPVGRVAKADTIEGVSEALLPRTPLTGGEGETADAIQRLIMQDADTTKRLARCGHCGSALIQNTGKGGAYRYYWRTGTCENESWSIVLRC